MRRGSEGGAMGGLTTVNIHSHYVLGVRVKITPALCVCVCISIDLQSMHIVFTENMSGTTHHVQ